MLDRDFKNDFRYPKRSTVEQNRPVFIINIFHSLEAFYLESDLREIQKFSNNLTACLKNSKKKRSTRNKKKKKTLAEQRRSTVPCCKRVHRSQGGICSRHSTVSDRDVGTRRAWIIFNRADNHGYRKLRYALLCAWRKIRSSDRGRSISIMFSFTVPRLSVSVDLVLASVYRQTKP